MLKYPGLYIFILLCFCYCADFAQGPSSDNIESTAASKDIDYSNLNNWAAHPWKYDTSDSVPEPLRKNYSPDSTVDIFFLHPTSYLDKSMPYGWNAPVNNEEINNMTDNRAILNQASVFNAAGRVFAPRYRQANYFAYFPEDTAAALAAFDKAYADIKAAFEYYMLHYNNGRPIIIASHSQGTTHAIRLIKEFFDSGALKNKLVAAYLVGIPVKPDDFKHIPVCSTPSQTGCVCSWRTLKEGFEPDYIQRETFTAIVTNPLTWSTDKPVASRQDNPGSILLKFNKVLPGIVNAKVHDGVLWVQKPKFFGNILYTNPNYHIADYNLFYVSIRNNVKEREQAYFSRSNIK